MILYSLIEIQNTLITTKITLNFSKLERQKYIPSKLLYLYPSHIFTYSPLTSLSSFLYTPEPAILTSIPSTSCSTLPIKLIYFTSYMGRAQGDKETKFWQLITTIVQRNPYRISHKRNSDWHPNSLKTINVDQTRSIRVDLAFKVNLFHLLSVKKNLEKGLTQILFFVWGNVLDRVQGSLTLSW